MPSADSFEQSLKRYDPHLSLRWGSHVQAWVVDRAAVKGISQALWDTLIWAANQPNCEPIDRERLDSAKQGKRPVLHTKVLGNHVFQTLWADDLQQHGTKVVDQHMKRLEENRLRKRNDDTVSRQAADGIDFLSRRCADPTPEEQRKVFEEVVGKSLSPAKARRKFNKSLLDQHGRELNPVKQQPEKKIQVAVR